MDDRSANAALEARGICAGYGRRLIVENLDLAIPEGSFTALIGPNGSGKSTVLRALAGVIRLSGGEVKLHGHAIARMPRKTLARKLSLLPQNPIAPEALTVLDLVRQGRYPHRSVLGVWSREDEKALQDALQLTGMDVFADSHLETLSGGQKQRAWIAMTVAQQADILLLDEPTTFLDIAHQLEVMELLLTLRTRRKATIVAVLHDINQAARYADHVVVVKEGRPWAEGTPPKVMTTEMLENVFGVQSRILPDPAKGNPYFLLDSICQPAEPNRPRRS